MDVSTIKEGATMPRDVEIEPDWGFFNLGEETIAEAVIHQAIHVATAPMRDALGACYDEIQVASKDALPPDVWKRVWAALFILDSLTVLNIGIVEKLTLAAVRAMPNRTDLTMDQMVAQVRHAMGTETPEQIAAQRGTWYGRDDPLIETYVAAESALWARKKKARQESEAAS
ncbi:MAG: hypothetical protein M3008_11585 [Chloroflexota bacterium]|nr:hypothetical protein [Chloroflexota bacterium]